jgi:hypothetical protein
MVERPVPQPTWLHSPSPHAPPRRQFRTARAPVDYVNGGLHFGTEPDQDFWEK